MKYNHKTAHKSKLINWKGYEQDDGFEEEGVYRAIRPQ